MESLLPRSCELARQWVSQRADGELSDFESAHLDGHLARCSPCAAFAHGIEGAVQLLRSAPLARLSRQVDLPVDLLPPRPARTSRRLRLPLSVTGVAGIAVAVAVAAALLVALALPSPQVVPIWDVQLSADNGRAELDSARLTAALARLPAAPAWSGHGAST